MTSLDPIVYLVEDDEEVRNSLSLLLRTKGLSPCSYPSAELFLDAYRRDQVCCLILDISLPGMSGLDLQRQMLAGNEPVPIIFITGHGDVPMAAQAFKAGAVDFLEKPVEDRHLLAAVDEAMARARALRTIRAETLRLRERFRSLTRRERDVMDRVVAGATNKAVANELRISPRTVEIYRRRVMEKMDVRTLADLVRLAESTSPTDVAPAPVRHRAAGFRLPESLAAPGGEPTERTPQTPAIPAVSNIIARRRDFL